MDGPPNNKDNDLKNMSRVEYARSIRNAIEERRQKALQNRQQYEPRVREQVARLFQEYQAPFYARARGFGRNRTLDLAQTAVLSLAAVHERDFADSETQALTEHFLSSVHNLVLWRWSMTGLAAYMTYRGRGTFRFPFFKPTFKATKFNPVGGRPPIQIMWHGARFVAYYVVLWVMAEPVFQASNFWRQRSAMEQDSRLRSLLYEKPQMDGEFGGQRDGNVQYGETWDPESQSESSRQQRAEPERASMPAQTQSAWASYRQPTPPPQSTQRSDSWDSSTDGIDDASPIASSARDQSSSTGNSKSGSAWDRLRQQSQYQPNNEGQQQDQRTWEKPQSGGGWGSDVDANSQFAQGARDNYSYSGSGEDKAQSKDQAQREFDRLLERERQGSEQDRGSWSKR